MIEEVLQQSFHQIQLLQKMLDTFKEGKTLLLCQCAFFIYAFLDTLLLLKHGFLATRPSFFFVLMLCCFTYCLIKESYKIIVIGFACAFCFLRLLNIF